MSENQLPLMQDQENTSPDPQMPAEKEAWRERLRAALRDPALRAIPGFPKGSDEAILALSDPPYYTACPNPFLEEILARWQQERAEIRRRLGLSDPSDPSSAEDENGYHREPFAADVSEGKNNPIYNAHSYHTKVPHPAIMRYILHYTDPGDIVFDGFCGTGMTGVAAQLCGDADEVRALGYCVDEEGWVWDGQRRISRLGARKAVLNDLSPAATFIAYNYNTPVDARAFEREARRILREVEEECGWMYETWHIPPASPSPQADPEEQDGEEEPERWYVPEALRRKMVEIAREFRKNPTPSEAILWQALRGKQLDGVKFRRQQPIGPFVVDFYAPSHRLIVEVDGGVHETQREKDRERQTLLESLGLRFVRIPAEKVEKDLPGALQMIRQALAAHPPRSFRHEGGGEHPHPQPLPHEGGGENLPSPLVGEGPGVREIAGEGKGVRETKGVKGKINYTVWSDVFLCPQCGAEMTFWDVAVDHKNGKVREEWPCPTCGVLLSKSPARGSGALRVERAFETKFDRALGQTVRQAKQVPVLINYSVGNRRYEKRPDAFDLALIEQIENSDIPYPFPTDALPKGDKTGDPFNVGITHVHHFYTRRNLWVLAALWAKAKRTGVVFRELLWLLTSVVEGASLLNRERTNGLPSKLSGTLYIASTIREIDTLSFLQRKAKKILTARSGGTSSGLTLITTSSAHFTSIDSESIDYIFVDPPFGGNLMYSELNFLWEAWLGVFTDNVPEAVENKTQGKGLSEYQRLMEACFREFYRVLKPGRWMTVEFHNSQNRVWNAIQEAILRAGFIVADVRSIDKQQGTFNQVTASGAVRQDLIISAYKPSAAFERRFRLQAGTVEGVWTFVRQHLAQLPVVVRKDGLLEPIAERMPYLLFDRMVAFHIQRGLTVPLSAAEFYAGLDQHFIERDGMYFNPDQVPEYDLARLEAEGLGQLSFIISDEKTAIQWLRRALDPKQGGAPQTYAELLPKFLRELHQAKHEALPELSELLEENFIQEADGRWRLPDPHKAADLETLRRKTLLREFKTYLEGQGRLRRFRTEAVRVGFADAYHRRDWQSIIKVAERLPEDVLQEDPELLMYYDAASLHM
ncbi:MAG: DUF559 domain-containing protein [Anaerolineales bacterium]